MSGWMSARMGSRTNASPLARRSDSLSNGPALAWSERGARERI
jgi:hypothetical protein